MRTPRFRMTPAAVADHRAAVAYLVAENPAAARRLAASLRAADARLAERPATAHRRDDLFADAAVRFATVGSRLIVLRTDVRPVLILRVIHASRNVARILGGSDPSEE